MIYQLLYVGFCYLITISKEQRTKNLKNILVFYYIND
jgi:hypothetical protein